MPFGFTFRDCSLLDVAMLTRHLDGNSAQNSVPEETLHIVFENKLKHNI